MVNIWIDDERHAPSNRWLWFKSAQEFYDWLDEPWGHRPWQQQLSKYGDLYINEISLDNDLGGELEGYDIVKRLVHKQVEVGLWNIHSANIIAKKNMVIYLQNAMKYKAIKQSQVTTIDAQGIYELESATDDLQTKLTDYLNNE